MFKKKNRDEEKRKREQEKKKREEDRRAQQIKIDFSSQEALQRFKDIAD